MGVRTAGKVLVSAKIEKLEDARNAADGHIPAGRVRSIEVTDALVDLDTPDLSMPKRLIERLGLAPVRMRRARRSEETVFVQGYEQVRLTIQGRDCMPVVSELPDDGPVRIGYLPVEHLDFVVDPVERKLVGNPAHGGEPMIELY